MLRVARIADRTGRYYLADIGADLVVAVHGDVPLPDPGVRHPGAHGQWVGEGAKGLGLSGGVDATSLERLLSGCHPTSGHPLRRRRTAVSAYDLTFAAPKSVSIVYGLCGPSAVGAVGQAHEEAVQAAMAYVGGQAASVRCAGSDGRTASPVGGVVAAAFTHDVSRALDPHLHSHVLVANIASGPDGRWRALDGRGLYAHARAAGALYDAVLRHGVTTRLGLEWSPTDARTLELSAVDPFLRGALSGRRAEILSHLHAYRPRSVDRTSPSTRARAVAWAATRPSKAPPSPLELRARWERTARDVGWSPELAIGCRQRGVGRAELDEHRFAAAIYEAGPSGVARRDAVAAWAGSLIAGGPGDEISRCVDTLCDWGSSIGVAEPRRAPAAVLAHPHVLRELGPRPAEPERLVVWQSAAASIERYRARWGLGSTWRPLRTVTRDQLAAMPARRLVDHLSTERAIDDALASLDRRHERDRGRRVEMARGLDRGDR
jgi:conjugative relaxase-like TrwC/TraI family protein